MGKFSGCFLASDYDGTLVDGNGTVLPQVREALKYYIAEGGLFTVCTGRTGQGFHMYDPEIVNAPVLLANGIMALDQSTNNTVFCYGIEKADAGIVDVIAKAFPQICVEFYSQSFMTYAVHLNERSEQHFIRQNIRWKNVASVKEAELPLVKIMLSAGEETADLAQRFLDGVIGGYNLKYIPSNGEYVEIIRKDCDKGKGMLRLAEMLGAAPDRVFAVGDGENDLDMLKSASMAFVPENGCKQAKAAADRTVRSNEDGAVAHVIELLDKMY